MPPDTNATDWLQPAPEQQGLKRNLETIRERKWFVLGIALVVTAAAVVYVLVAHRTYQAEADLLVTPLPADTNVDQGISLLRQTNDPARDVETAANLIDTDAIASLASKKLGGAPSAATVADDVSVAPVSASSIVAVTAQSGSATEARDIANAYARAAIAERTASMHRQIDQQLPVLQAQLRGLPAGSTAADNLGAAVVQLQGLRASKDPTIQLNSVATTPSSPVWPKPVLTIAIAAVLGIVLGVLGAVALRVLDPRLRREEQLRQLFRLPILARIPRQPSRKTGRPLPRERLSAPAIEAYRTLRATLTASARDARTILVTGPSASTGKTTTAINLSTALAVAGNRVVLIEADVRRPSIADALGVEVERGVTSVLLGESTLDESLVDAPILEGGLKLLLADQVGPGIAELISLPPARRLVEEATWHADYVVIDSAPLTEVVDALPLASYVDQVLIVVRLGATRLAKLKDLADMLASNGVTPAGFAVVGTLVGRGRQYYYTREEYVEQAEEGRRLRRRDVSSLERVGAPQPSGTNVAKGEERREATVGAEEGNRSRGRREARRQRS